MTSPSLARLVSFAAALRDCTGGQQKILRRDYLKAGPLPVVDQGAELIAGYTEDESGAYSGRLPVIIFGDHTRIFKYIDFPFAIGADGTKVLEPSSLFEPRFLYYYLCSHQIPSRGYSRHFNLLRDMSFPWIPLSEQRRIVEILDQADRLRRLRAGAGAKAERILPALFVKMFGDPTTNPMCWPVVTLGELSVLGPQYGANARSAPLEPGAPRYIRITDILDNGRLTEDEVGIDMGEWQPYRLEEGDLLFARSGATVGKTYVHRIVKNPCVFAGYLIRFRLNPARLHPLVAFSFTQTTAYRTWVESKRRTAAQPNINGQEYAGLLIPVPDRDAQGRFVDAYMWFEHVRKRSQLSSRHLDTLFSVLSGSAFDGSLTASWREAHMKELLQEMEQQAKALATG